VRWSAATRLGRREAGFGARLGAWLLDSIATTLLMAAVAVPLVLYAVSRWETELGTCRDTFDRAYVCDVPTGGAISAIFQAFALGFVASLAIGVLYFGVGDGRGQTLGKRIAGIAVVDATSGAPIGTGRGIGRFLGRYLSSFLYLGYLWMLWDDDSQTWHDKLVNSIVVKT
jgi:uncharacterized RDD family membrane protein YckC